MMIRGVLKKLFQGSPKTRNAVLNLPLEMATKIYTIPKAQAPARTLKSIAGIIVSMMALMINPKPYTLNPLTSKTPKPLNP